MYVALTCMSSGTICWGSPPKYTIPLPTSNEAS